MRHVPPLWLAATLALAGAPAAHAQAIANTRIDYAQVLRVDPVYEVTTVQAVDPACLAPNRPRASIGTAVGACKPRTTQVRTVVAYDVEYSYKGEVYMSRMESDPGNRLRIRVSVAPAEDDRPAAVAPAETR